MLLSDKYPFLARYFTELLKGDKFPQALLFYGSDLDSQYVLANEVARLLNCGGDKSDECDCLNCRWIREHTHPAVMTVSKVDNKPEDDGSKTVISVEQAGMIKNMLVNSSDYHRVFIFCDRDENGNIAGINRKNFQDYAANSLLKIIEEPDERVTFIFLTRYREDVLSTIISRSQCFFVPSLNDVSFDYEVISGVFDRYWEISRGDVFDISQRLQDLAKEKGGRVVLEGIQNYILQVLKSNPRESELINHIHVLEDCLKREGLGIKPAYIFDDLCLRLIKG